ncbi:PilZ domain-containing protein [Andreprevotia chitinilytica]|uniref:PilZ domain-containing protein n=1 Tax=Andreprevotia chitinilytica TaxID=396808 RepID=UPI000554184A|nr:PilZ domain-containing protein [Andreprevotia chitinilytica]
MADFSDGVWFAAELPVVWLPASQQSTFEACRYLDVLTAFEQAGAAEVRPEDAKLDLQLLWLARVLTPQLPPVGEVKLGLEHVEWRATAKPDQDDSWLGIALSNLFPYLVSLPIHLESAVNEGGNWRCTAAWRVGDELLRDALERTIFRRHREQIRRLHSTQNPTTD